MNEKAKVSNNGSFLKLFKTLTARVLSSLKIRGLYCCSCFKHYLTGDVTDVARASFLKDCMAGSTILPVWIGSTPTFSYFDLYLYSAYAAQYVYFYINCCSLFTQKVFAGNSEKDKTVYNLLLRPMVGRFVRFFPLSGTTTPCMRVELYRYVASKFGNKIFACAHETAVMFGNAEQWNLVSPFGLIAAARQFHMLKYEWLSVFFNH